MVQWRMPEAVSRRPRRSQTGARPRSAQHRSGAPVHEGSPYGLRPEAVEYNESAEVLQHVWIAARSSLREVFEQVSIQSLADRRLPRHVAALTRDEEAWKPH